MAPRNRTRLPGILIAVVVAAGSVGCGGGGGGSSQAPIDVATLKGLLAAGHGWMCGLEIHQSFYQAQANGNVAVPGGAGDPVLGGHELYCFGYQDDPKYAGGGYFRILNQWGSGPGTWFSPNNFLQIPYDYWTKGFAMDATCLALAPTNPTPEAGR